MLKQHFGHHPRGLLTRRSPVLSSCWTKKETGRWANGLVNSRWILVVGECFFHSEIIWYFLVIKRGWQGNPLYLKALALMGNSSINDGFSIAGFDYRREGTCIEWMYIVQPLTISAVHTHIYIYSIYIFIYSFWATICGCISWSERYHSCKQS